MKDTFATFCGLYNPGDRVRIKRSRVLVGAAGLCGTVADPAPHLDGPDEIPVRIDGRDDNAWYFYADELERAE